MSDKSKIEWTNATWNPAIGCTKISAGCEHCYAERMAHRLQAMRVKRYRDGFAVRCQPDLLTVPDRWRKPRLVFVCSMGDLFHPDVPDAFIGRVFETMIRNPHHTFQVLTKRSARMRDLAPVLDWPDHVWAGVTVESGDHVERIADLEHVDAAVRFASFEPLLGPVDFELAKHRGPIPRRGATYHPLIGVLDWAICGGETGPGARPMDEDSAVGLRDICAGFDVPFFFKQWGGSSGKGGRTIGGVLIEQMPRRSTTGGSA